MTALYNMTQNPDFSADPALFREGMSRLASPVHVITTAGEAGLNGFTATAVASVSDSPPAVLVCVKADGASAQAIASNGVFAIHALGEAHQELADRFAGRGGLQGADRFKGLDYTLGPSGAPLLASALAVFECHLASAERHGSHLICIGDVVQVILGEPDKSLLYARRSYHAI